MKTLKVFIDTTTTTVSQSNNNQLPAQGQNPRDQHKHSIRQAGSPPFIHRHHSGNKTDSKKKRYQGLLVKEVLVHNCTDIKQRVSHSKQDIFTVRELIISSQLCTGLLFLVFVKTFFYQREKQKKPPHFAQQNIQ